jgi:hypothetical protein
MKNVIIQQKVTQLAKTNKQPTKSAALDIKKMNSQKDPN